MNHDIQIQLYQFLISSRKIKTKTIKRSDEINNIYLYNKYIMITSFSTFQTIKIYININHQTKFECRFNKFIIYQKKKYLTKIERNSFIKTIL